MEKLKQYLKKSGISQAELGRLTGVTQPTVWEWLNGHSTPTPDRLVALSKITGLSVDQLLNNRTAA